MSITFTAIFLSYCLILKKKVFTLQNNKLNNYEKNQYYFNPYGISIKHRIY